MDNIIIRDITKEDIPQVVDIQISGWRTAYKGIIDDEYIENMNIDEKIKKREKDYKDNRFIVTEINKEIVGFCRYTDNMDKTSVIPEADCELIALYVKPDLKRRGIGKKMFQYTINELKHMNKTKMLVWCLKDNAPSRKFYEKMGGKISKERLIHIGNIDYEEVAFEYDINKEHDFYNEIKNWDFSEINYTQENFINWDMYEILRTNVNKESRILDIGTGGGEKVLKYFPDAKEIIATDFSEEMIKTANENLKKSDRTNIIFRKMDNLNMDTPSNYFDAVVARHTCIDAKQIYNTLKLGGILILRGVDKLDCWELKRLFGKGQAYKDINPISLIDYENILDAGFKDVELIPIHIREYYKTKEDLLALLLKTPILYDFSETQNNKQLKIGQTDLEVLDRYIERNKKDKGILLIRSYYGITARK